MLAHAHGLLGHPHGLGLTGEEPDSPLGSLHLDHGVECALTQ